MQWLGPSSIAEKLCKIDIEFLAEEEGSVFNTRNKKAYIHVTRFKGRKKAVFCSGTSLSLSNDWQL